LVSRRRYIAYISIETTQPTSINMDNAKHYLQL
jgi:hypothetical protein